MDEFGHDFHDAFLSGGRDTSRLFHDERHGSSLIQQSKLSVRVLGVSGITENTSVQQSTVDITDHGTDVSAGESFSALSSSLTPSRDNIFQRLVPLVEVGFVHRVDVAILRDFDVGLGEDELSEGLIKGEDVDTISEGQGEESGRGVQAVGCRNQVRSGLKGVGEALSLLFRALLTDACRIDIAVFTVLVNSDDGSGGDSGVDVGRTIEGIKNGDVFLSLFDDDFLGVGGRCPDQVDGNIFLFGSKNTQASGESKSSLQQVVRDDIKLLLVFSLDVYFSLVPKSFARWKLGSLHQIGHGLAGRVDGAEKSGQFAKLRVEHGNFVHETSEGDSGGVTDFVEHGNFCLVSGHRRRVDGGRTESRNAMLRDSSGAESVGGERRHEDGTDRKFHCDAAECN
mmetsp:Transcript_9551/g.23451  ORF Transcript_9551/g.23451 Transcript_9551/m.23451 type:complete len:397 (-) Transcript_9551:124-1314(-)